MLLCLVHKCNFVYSSESDDSLPPEKQATFLVYETALLLLFRVCVYCGAKSVNLQKFINGTFLRITQLCKNCQKSRTWESQPFVGRLPAGNLLTSASILYSGSSPAKVLRVFSILNCATISLSTFFRHQGSFLIKAVHSVYNRNQSSLISTLRAKEPLALAGDGRADSPGHSAKFGTYTVIDLHSNKVLAFKLVQVGIQ